MLIFLTEQRRRLFNGKLSIAKEALTAISRKFIKAIFFDGRGGACGGGKTHKFYAH
jgi:hypothetical protein